MAQWRESHGGLTPLKRRTKWIIGLGVGIPLLLIGGIALVLILSSPNLDAELASIETKDIPSTWFQDTPEGLMNPEPGTEGPAPGKEAEVSLDDLGLPINGTFVVQNDERPFGEETFMLVIEEDRVILRANGKFWFKALVATVTVTFDEILELDTDLYPLSFFSSFEAPLGFERSTNVEFEDDRAVVRSKDDETEFAVDSDSAFVLGTFSTYALIPLLYELRESAGAVTLEVLVFGGPPNQDDDAAAGGLPKMRVEKIEDSAIRFDGEVLAVSRYILSGDMGAMTLYARGVELLGLYAGDDEESMFVYRADYFENGFEIGN